MPAPGPNPAPTTPLLAFAQPLITLAPSFVGTPADAGFSVVGGGVRMPGTQLASLAPEEELIPQSVGPAVAPEASAFLPTPAAPVVPVYPRKQARH